MGKRRLLDLCCCAGGASVGYARAGFEVVGVDSEPQPDYPYTFIQADALTVSLAGYDAYHASPTCKGFSHAAWFHHSQDRHLNLIPALRARLAATGKPYIIENVAGAPLHKCLMLCGEMFGLDVIRHRYFESNILLRQPRHPRHCKPTGKPGAIPAPGEHWCVGGHQGHKEEAARAMGIDWMTRQSDIAQAIPPRIPHSLDGNLPPVIDNWTYGQPKVRCLVNIEIACWLRVSSFFPEIEVERPYDDLALPYDLVLELMNERQETYLFKAAVALPSGIRRFEDVSLPPVVKEHLATVAVVKCCWSLLLADGIDPVTCQADDVRSFLPAYSRVEPLLARWSRLAMASDRRLFAALWTDRRADAYRCRLLAAEEAAVGEGV